MTPSESAARNFEGTVRRFLASSVWSYCPRKPNLQTVALAVLSWACRPDVWTSGMAEWEELRHPKVVSGPHFTPLFPTWQHQLPRIPTRGHRPNPGRARFSLQIGGFAGPVRRSRARSASRLAEA